MRKQSFLFIAGAVLALASCQNENTDTSADQAQIDSIVNARVEEMRVEMMMQNDSMINALATLRADSIIAAMKGGNTVTTKTNTTRTTTVKDNGSTKSTTTKDGRLDIDKGTSKDKDGRLDIDKATKPTDKSKDNDGRLKID